MLNHKELAKDHLGQVFIQPKVSASNQSEYFIYY